MPPQPHDRPREWREVYTAHPYLWAAIPIVVGVAAATAGVLKHHVFGYVVGVTLAGWGIVIEVLNVIDAIWRIARRRRPS
ncbi:MAG: hypothetical protein ACREPA_10070 [Candidatus Dormibacteraceae bacterium]